MVKTSTSTHSLNSCDATSQKPVQMPEQQQDEMFYESIKPQLDQLIREPSNETIEKILAYAGL